MLLYCQPSNVWGTLTNTQHVVYLRKTSWNILHLRLVWIQSYRIVPPDPLSTQGVTFCFVPSPCHYQKSLLEHTCWDFCLSAKMHGAWWFCETNNLWMASVPPWHDTQVWRHPLVTPYFQSSFIAGCYNQLLIRTSYSNHVWLLLVNSASSSGWIPW